MRLNIEDFAKIKEADIIIDGITVIAGENNTGKSTVGKILFSMFNSLQNIEDKILDDRAVAVRNSCIAPFFKHVRINSSDFSDYVWITGTDFYRSVFIELKEISEKNNMITQEVVADTVQKVMELLRINLDNVTDSEAAIQNICENIITVWNVPEETIIRERISRYFNKVFSTQINMLSDKEYKESVLTLKIKEKHQKVIFQNNDCVKYEQETEINHKAIYIDNPLIIDYLGSKKGLNPMEEMLTDLLNEDKDDLFSGVVEKILTEEKLTNIYKMLQTVVDGEIVVDQNKKILSEEWKIQRTYHITESFYRLKIVCYT